MTKKEDPCQVELFNTGPPAFTVRNKLSARALLLECLPSLPKALGSITNNTQTGLELVSQEDQQFQVILCTLQLAWIQKTLPQKKEEREERKEGRK